MAVTNLATVSLIVQHLLFDLLTLSNSSEIHDMAAGRLWYWVR